MFEERLIESIAKENYLHYKQSIQENLDKLTGKTVVIFGAGIIGLQFSDILKSTAMESVVFCDNNQEKWGTVLNGYEVIAPEKLVGQRDKYFVFLAMENYEACAKQLEEMSYHINENWLNLTNVSEVQLIRDFCSASEKKNIVFGDCITSNVAITEDRKISLGEFIMQDESVQVLGLNGLHVRAYYMLLLMLLEKNSSIKKVVLLLDISIFYEKYHLFPKNQHEAVMKELGVLSGLESEEMQEYIRVIGERSRENGNFYMVAPERNKKLSPEQVEQGRMMHMRLNQMFILHKESESMVYLAKFIDVCRERNIAVSTVMLPVNYELGEKYFGEKFYEKYNAICDGIKRCATEAGARWLDLSFLLSQEHFITVRSASEGIWEEGRRKIAMQVEELLKEA